MYSILNKNEIKINNEAPSFFINLNLNQVLDSIIKNEEDKNIKKYFYSPLNNIEDINYRLDVFKELDRKEFYVTFNSCFGRLRKVYERYKANEYEVSTSWDGKKTLVRIINTYIEAIEDLYKELINDKEIKSEAILELIKYIDSFQKSNEFINLITDVNKLGEIVSKIRYTMVFNGCDIYVSPFDPEHDKDFEPFVKDALRDFEWESTKEFNYSVNEMTSSKLIDHNVLEALSHLYKNEFKNVSDFCKKYEKFYNEDLYKIVSDTKFYLLYDLFMDKIKSANLTFAYPNFINDYKEECIDLYDLALANRLVVRKEEIVLNSYNLSDNERIMIISGPNQGGKTTFARALGEIHYLASLGLPVPARFASLHLVKNICTIFKTEEEMESLNGKLQSELILVQEIMDKIDEDSFIIFNEIFASTTSLDGYELSKNIINIIKEKGSFAIFITFIDELSSSSDITVAYRSNVLKDNPMIRTYKITKEETDGKAYANAISKKYHLSYDEIRRRIK